MASTKFAVQPSVYESVSRMNRQRRAVGRKEDEGAGYTAYRAALDSSAARALQAQQIEINKERTELMKEAYKDEAAASTVSGIASLGLTGVMAYDKLAPHFASKAVSELPALATPTPPPGLPAAAAAGAQKAIAAPAAEFTSNVAGVEVPVATEALSSSTAAAGSATSALTPGTMTANLAGAGGALAIEAVKDPIADWAKDTFGGEADDVVGIGARAGQGAMVGAGMGGMFGAAVGAVAGGVVGVVEEIADGSHICTAAHLKFGLPLKTISAMGKLRGYADSYHREEMTFYLRYMPSVLKQMGKEADDFLYRFKKRIAPVVAALIEKDKMELAFKLYRKTTEGLFVKYKPELLEQL